MKLKRTPMLCAGAAVLLFAGCGNLQADAPTRGYPAPASESERAEQCSRIRAAMANEQDRYNQVAIFDEGLVAIYNRVRLEENLSWLQARAREAHCADYRYGRCGYHPLCWPG